MPKHITASRFCLALFLGLAFAAMAPGPRFAVKAEQPQAAPPAKCKVAEVNPVTGHAVCIKPVGAPVEAPPAPEPCKADQGANGDRQADSQGKDHSKEAWSFGPKCKTLDKAVKPPSGA